MGEFDRSAKPTAAPPTHQPEPDAIGERVLGWKPLRVTANPVFPTNDPLDLGDVEVGSRAVRDVWIVNDDDVSRPLAGVHADGAFRVDKAPATIAPNQSVAATVAFAPASDGPAHGKLVVSPKYSHDATLDLVARGTPLVPHGSNQKPAPAVASKPSTPHHHQLALPPAIELEGVVDKSTALDAPLIFALDSTADQGPRFQARVKGIQGLAVSRAPGYLPTNRVAPDELSHIRFDYRPTREGPVTGALELEMLDAPLDRVTIPIHVRAYRGGIPEPMPKERPPLQRLPSVVDLGEQIVGSEHQFVIGETGFAKPYPARGVLTTRLDPARPIPNIPDSLRMDFGSDAFSVFAGEQDFDSHYPGHREPVAVRFKPTRTGKFVTDLIVTIRWDDGHVDTQRVAVKASARTLDDAPAQPKLDDDAGQIVEPPLHGAHASGKHPTTEQAMMFSTEANAAADQISNLATRQSIGVAAAKDAVNSFDKQADPDPPMEALFRVLADLALTMVTGGIGQVIGKAAATAVGKALTGLGSKEAKKLVLVDGLGSAFKDGFKAAAQQAIKSKPAAGSVSGDRFKFFERQTTILADLVQANRELVRAEERRLTPMYGTHPREVLAVFKAFQETFRAQADHAQEEQQRATVSQWVIGIARASHGHTVAKRGDDQVGDATKLDVPGLNMHGDGVLELEVDLSDRDWTFQVTEIAIRGVAHQAMDIVKTADLRSLGIPIRVIAKSEAGTAYITRDEAGRVHVAGVLPNQDRLEHGPDLDRAPGPITTNRDLENLGRRDQQLNRDASLLCERLLDRSLASWNRPIKTNDKNGDKR